MLTRTLLLILGCMGLVSLLVPAARAQSAPTIRILKPADRHNVPLGETTVTVEITGVTPDDGHYWVVQVDGVPSAIVRDGRTSTAILMDKPSGPRRIRAVLYDAQGAVLASHEVLAIAAPVQPDRPVFNRVQMAPAMAVLVLIVISLIAIGLRVRPRPAE